MANAEVGVKKPEEADKCADCNQTVGVRDKTIECEVCDRLFHIKCQGVNDETYRILKKNSGVHWYCKGCDYGVGKVLKTMAVIQQKQDKMEERQDKLEKEFAEVKLQIQRTGPELELKLKDLIDVENCKKFEESKKLWDQWAAKRMQEVIEGRMMEVVSKEYERKFEDTKKCFDEGLFKMKEQLCAEVGTKETWKDVVSQEIENKFTVIAADITLAQKAAEEMKGTIAEEAEKLRRKNNIIIYNIPESLLSNIHERNSEEKEYCKDLMRDVLKVGWEEGDVKKILRLGKKTDSERPRPVLVEFSNGHTKNLVMENAPKLGKAEGKFEGVTISHDMTVNEREYCKKLVAEAKQKQAEDGSGEYVYKVRGPPGQMKIMKFKKY